MPTTANQTAPVDVTGNIVAGPGSSSSPAGQPAPLVETSEEGQTLILGKPFTFWVVVVAVVAAVWFFFLRPGEKPKG